MFITSCRHNGQKSIRCYCTELIHRKIWRQNWQNAGFDYLASNAQYRKCESTLECLKRHVYMVKPVICCFHSIYPSTFWNDKAIHYPTSTDRVQRKLKAWPRTAASCPILHSCLVWFYLFPLHDSVLLRTGDFPLIGLLLSKNIIQQPCIWYK